MLRGIIIGAMAATLVCSVAFNIYQSGQLNACQLVPSIQPINIED